MADMIGRIDGETEPRRQRDGAEHADRVFDKANLRIADAADDAGPQIVQTARVVDDRERRDVVEQRVDREVAAKRVFFGRAEGVVAMDEMLVTPRVRADGRCAVRCGQMFISVQDRSRHPVLGDLFTGLQLAPEGRDLDDFWTKPDVSQSEPSTDDPTVSEELFDLVRVRGRSNVEILGSSPKKQIAHASTDEVSSVVSLTQPV